MTRIFFMVKGTPLTQRTLRSQLCKRFSPLLAWAWLPSHSLWINYKHMLITRYLSEFQFFFGYIRRTAKQPIVPVLYHLAHSFPRIPVACVVGGYGQLYFTSFIAAKADIHRLRSHIAPIPFYYLCRQNMAIEKLFSFHWALVSRCAF